jgi:hypothetical protein
MIANIGSKRGSAVDLNFEMLYVENLDTRFSRV